MKRNDIIDGFVFTLINGESEEVKESIRRLYLNHLIGGEQLSSCVGWLITLAEYNEIIEGE